MEPVTRVQILEDAIYVFLYTLGMSMKPSALYQAMEK